MLRLGHVLQVMNDVSQRLKGQTPVLISIRLGRFGQRIVKILSPLLVGKWLVRAEIGVVFQSPVRRGRTRHRAANDQALPIRRIEKMVKRLNLAAVVLEAGTELDQFADRHRFADAEPKERIGIGKLLAVIVEACAL